MKTAIWLMIALACLLSSCGTVADVGAVDEETTGRGGGSPQQVVESFFEDFNQALNDPTLTQTTTQTSWAERLANYFAPSERNDQRNTMRGMLAQYAYQLQQLDTGDRLSLSVGHEGAEIIERNDDTALVRLAAGTLYLRWSNAQGEVYRERSADLTEVLGQTSGGFPVLRVGGRWFLTEG